MTKFSRTSQAMAAFMERQIQLRQQAKKHILETGMQPRITTYRMNRSMYRFFADLLTETINSGRDKTGDLVYRKSRKIHFFDWLEHIKDQWRIPTFKNKWNGCVTYFEIEAAGDFKTWVEENFPNSHHRIRVGGIIDIEQDYWCSGMNEPPPSYVVLSYKYIPEILSRKSLVLLSAEATDAVFKKL